MVVAFELERDSRLGYAELDRPRRQVSCVVATIAGAAEERAGDAALVERDAGVGSSAGVAARQQHKVGGQLGTRDLSPCLALTLSECESTVRPRAACPTRD